MNGKNGVLCLGMSLLLITPVRAQQESFDSGERSSESGETAGSDRELPFKPVGRSGDHPGGADVGLSAAPLREGPGS